MGTLRYVCAPKGQQAGSDGVACVHSQTPHSSMQMREHPGPFCGQRQHARDELQSGVHRCNLHLIKSPPGSPHGPPHSHQEVAATDRHFPSRALRAAMRVQVTFVCCMDPGHYRQLDALVRDSAQQGARLDVVSHAAEGSSTSTSSSRDALGESSVPGPAPPASPSPAEDSKAAVPSSRCRRFQLPRPPENRSWGSCCGLVAPCAGAACGALPCQEAS